MMITIILKIISIMKIKMITIILKIILIMKIKMITILITKMITLLVTNDKNVHSEESSMNNECSFHFVRSVFPFYLISKTYHNFQIFKFADLFYH